MALMPKIKLWDIVLLMILAIIAEIVAVLPLRSPIPIGSGGLFFRDSIPVSSPFVCDACGAEWVRLPRKCSARRRMTIGMVPMLI